MAYEILPRQLGSFSSTICIHPKKQPGARFSQDAHMVVKDGDESHGTIHTKISKQMGYLQYQLLLVLVYPHI